MGKCRDSEVGKCRDSEPLLWCLQGLEGWGQRLGMGRPLL